MNPKMSIVVAASLALFLSACGSRRQNLIFGTWEATSATAGGADAGPEVGNALDAIKMTAAFNPDGTARITMFGRTLQGTYKFDGNELEWTVNGITTKRKASVTATELEVADDADRTIKYKRK
jgi:hypothetical protein